MRIIDWKSCCLNVIILRLQRSIELLLQNLYRSDGYDSLRMNEQGERDV